VNAENFWRFPYIKHGGRFRGVGETKFNKPCRLVMLDRKNFGKFEMVCQNEDLENFYVSISRKTSQYG
jgi:hypothetical protein